MPALMKRHLSAHRRASLAQSLVILAILIVILTVVGFITRRIIDGALHDLFLNVAAALIGVQVCIVFNRFYDRDG